MLETRKIVKRVQYYELLYDIVSNSWKKNFILGEKFCQYQKKQSPLSYRNQSIDLLCKSMDCFLYDNGLRQSDFHSVSIKKNIV